MWGGGSQWTFFLVRWSVTESRGDGSDVGKKILFSPFSSSSSSSSSSSFQKFFESSTHTKMTKDAPLFDSFLISGRKRVMGVKLTQYSRRAGCKGILSSPDILYRPENGDVLISIVWMGAECVCVPIRSSHQLYFGLAVRFWCLSSSRR